MASEDVQTNLRLPAELKDLLVATAERNKRSLSAEVAARLEASFRTPSSETPDGVPFEDIKLTLMEQTNRLRAIAEALLVHVDLKTANAILGPTGGGDEVRKAMSSTDFVFSADDSKKPMEPAAKPKTPRQRKLPFKK